MAKQSDLSVHYQAAFSTDGYLEVSDESIETSLEDYGADVDHRDVDSRIERPVASEFGVDDRAELRRSDTESSDHASLFVNTAEDRQLLGGRAGEHPVALRRVSVKLRARSDFCAGRKLRQLRNALFEIRDLLA